MFYRNLLGAAGVTNALAFQPFVYFFFFSDRRLITTRSSIAFSAVYSVSTRRTKGDVVSVLSFDGRTRDISTQIPNMYASKQWEGKTIVQNSLYYVLLYMLLYKSCFCLYLYLGGGSRGSRRRNIRLSRCFHYWTPWLFSVGGKTTFAYSRWNNIGGFLIYLFFNVQAAVIALAKISYKVAVRIGPYFVVVVLIRLRIDPDFYYFFFVMEILPRRRVAAQQ